MVETSYHYPNRSSDDESDPPQEFLWIVEPSQDGSLYGYTPGAPVGMQNLGLTVKQLVEDLSPHESHDPPVSYTGEKKNTLYTVDVGSGNILKMFSSGSSAVLDSNSCRRVNALEGSEEEECAVSGTLTLSRTEYTVAIHNRDSGDPMCTIRYFEWGPNNRDRDLHNQYLTTKDNRYIYSMHDGRILAMDVIPDESKKYEFADKPTFRQKLGSPVARVFDVARPIHDQSPDPRLVILPQPVGPTVNENPFLNEENRIFVNCTESGSWYALSEDRYPMVTSGAFRARSASEDWTELSQQQESLPYSTLRDALIGVHSLAYQAPLPPEIPLIGGPEGQLRIDNPLPPREADQHSGSMVARSSGVFSGVSNIFTLPTLSAVVILLTCLGYFKISPKRIPGISTPEIPRSSEMAPIAFPEPTAEGLVEPFGQKKPEEIPKTVTFAGFNSTDTEVKDSKENLRPARSNSDLTAPDDVTPKKKKAHRGKRGGKALREKQGQGRSDSANDLPNAAESIAEGVKQQGQDITVKPDVVIKKGQSEAGGPAGLQNLTIHTEKVLGNGSGGTFVFEGEFEGRDVAVKRMLPQYFELASQEVSLLEQSEDHPNVIRYFCRREDEHFLYIALELCQASLWDLFRDGRGDDMPDQKHTSLIQQVASDPKSVLRQLAEGVKYLHSFRIVHRDIKPQNMLIAYPKKNNLSSFPRFVISDFGLCKTLPENASTLIGTTGNAGTAGWKAPELIFQPKESTGSQHSTGRDSVNGGDAANAGTGGVKRAVDIFSLGCVFFYVLTCGQHPFDDEEGWMQLRERNIKTSRANFSALDIFGPDTEDLIRWMLSPRPEDRPTASQVLAHPFFWDAEERLEFLSSASDRFDHECRDPPSEVLQELETHAEAIIPKTVVGTSSFASSAIHSHLRHDSSNGSQHTPNGMATQMHLPVPEPNFLAALDRRFVDTLGRQRKYNPAKLADLLRALRNKHHHWDDMPDDMKAKIGEVPEGYLRYWESRFPGLVVGVWRVIVELGLGSERRFGRWFSSKRF